MMFKLQRAYTQHKVEPSSYEIAAPRVTLWQNLFLFCCCCSLMNSINFITVKKITMFVYSNTNYQVRNHFWFQFQANAGISHSLCSMILKCQPSGLGLIRFDTRSMPFIFKTTVLSGYKSSFCTKNIN